MTAPAKTLVSIGIAHRNATPACQNTDQLLLKLVQSRFAETPTLTLTLNPNFGETGFGESGFGETGRHPEITERKAPLYISVDV